MSFPVSKTPAGMILLKIHITTISEIITDVRSSAFFLYDIRVVPSKFSLKTGRYTKLKPQSP